MKDMMEQYPGNNTIHYQKNTHDILRLAAIDMMESHLFQFVFRKSQL